MKFVISPVLLFVLTQYYLMPGIVSAGEIGTLLSSSLKMLSEDSDVRIIIYFDQVADYQMIGRMDRRDRRQEMNKILKEKAASSQRVTKDMLQKNNVYDIQSFWHINGIAAKVPAGLVSRVAALPGVRRVVLDAKIKQPNFVYSTDSADVAWNIDATQTPDIWQEGTDGAGIVVAVMDTGVDKDHQDLSDSWRGGTNSWFDPHGEHALPYDHSGHGTHVASIIAGDNKSDIAIGMAPGAQWIGVKLFDDNGEASYSDIHAGFQWLLDPDNNPVTDDSPDIVNNSWGFDGLVNQCFLEFQADIELLKASGIAVNFSSGNTGPNTASSISPANYSNSFSVGAIDADLDVAGFSGRGPSACHDGFYPQMVAPGVDIISADLSFGGQFTNNYAVVSGTSFAVPHISGAMALLKNAYTWLSVEEMELVLRQSAVVLTEQGPDHDFGHGLVNVVNAFQFVRDNHCISGDDTYIDVNCERPPVIPPSGGGGSVPILQMLLGDIHFQESFLETP